MEIRSSPFGGLRHSFPKRFALVAVGVEIRSCPFGGLRHRFHPREERGDVILCKSGNQELSLRGIETNFEMSATVVSASTWKSGAAPSGD